MMRFIGFAMNGAGLIAWATGAAGLLVGIASLLAGRRQGHIHARDIKCMREDMERGHEECRERINEIHETLAAAQRSAQANLDLLRDGRLGMPGRARAIRMLRSGMAANTAAEELGLPRNEVQLLGKVIVMMAPRS